MIGKVLCVVFSLGLAGCATTSKDFSMQQLQLRVAELERQVDMKDEEIQTLKEDVQQMSWQMNEPNDSNDSAPDFDSEVEGSSRPVVPKKLSKSDQEIIRVAVNTDEVQRALSNAGYYNGTIDGKIGEKTKNAIKEFQQDHGLKADGIIGNKTWLELKSYLQ